MKIKLLSLILFGLPFTLLAQITFTDSSSDLVNSNLNSGVAIGVSDMNGDGLDDIIRLSGASNLEIEYQSVSGTFTRLNYGDIGSGSEWGMAIADIDRNGYNDIIAGGAYNNIKVLTANNSGTGYSLSTLSSPSIFVQNMNFADIDNNGTIDIFSCHDDGVSSPYSNDGNGNMTYSLSLINAESTIPSDNSGNYGTIWIDYDNDGDLDLYMSKCRLGASNPMDGRRLNMLFENDGSGNYTDVASAKGLRPGAQSWSAAFEDIDNDDDLDCVLINHDMTSQIYENDGSGNFSDITSSSGISSILNSIGSDGIQVIMEDFNNDTFVDILITSRGSEHYLFTNDGDKTFTRETSPFPGSSRIQSAAAGDLNNDGFLDVIAGYANGYNGPSNPDDRLFLNDGNSNNWSKINLEGVTSNINGIGARIEIYGAWGKQIREVRSGESYGTMNSMFTHFGIANATEITQIIVKWPSGTVDTLLDPAINTTHNILEGQTLSNNQIQSTTFKIFPNPVADILTISANEIPENLNLKLYDITGKSVLTTSPIISANSIELNISTLNSGVYFMHLSSGTSSFVYKIVKE